MQGEYVFLLLAVLFFAYTLFKKIKIGWYVRWSEGVPKRPTLQGEGWYIDFPTSGHLNDVLLHVPFTKKKFLKGAKSITVRGNIVGGGFVTMENFDPNTNPPTATLMLQRRNDRPVLPEQDPKYMTYRWYSSQMIPLAAGEFEMTFPLNASDMGGVMGSHDPNAFEDAISDLLGFGIVFGSAGGRAHGVRTSESGRFTLSSYRINR